MKNLNLQFKIQMQNLDPEIRFEIKIKNSSSKFNFKT